MRTQITGEARLGALPGAMGEEKLGTFLGVYTPTLLTILGVILYLRLGWVLGHAGLVRTLAIVALANAITLVTVLSVSAAVTNTRIGVGGAYFLISRSLGAEFGGAVGLPLFLAQVFSVTLYAFGLAESLRLVWSDLPIPATALAIVAGVGALAFRGPGRALRTQLPMLGLIALSLGALGLGAIGSGELAGLGRTEPSGQFGLWALFAVFFPAVTGIMAGLGLSGDLREPIRSIPRGALAAQLTGTAVYLLVPFLLAAAAPPELLRSDSLVWTRIAPLGAWLVLPGLWGAVFSSALGSMLGAPRTLQALAMDHLAPHRLAGVAGRVPRLGLGIAVALALAAVFLGNLNTVAAVVTMFFLTVYGSINLAVALEGLSGDPSWRPSLRVPWPLSLAAAAACFATMLLINATAAVFALGIELALWLLLQRREREAEWGDVRRGVYEALIRWALLRMLRRPTTPRSWRPHMLVFTEPSEQRLDLVRLGDWFTHDRSVLIVCELIVGDLAELTEDPAERQAEIQALLRRAGLVAFAEVNVVGSIESGIIDVTQANGMAGLVSNVVLLGVPSNEVRLAALLRVARRLERLHKSVILARGRPPEPQHEQPRTVHVWWGGLQRNSDLMLLLAYLLTRSHEWRDARIRVMSLASNELMRSETERLLARLMPEIRIQADVKVTVKPPDISVRDLIHAESAEADLVFLGLDTPGPEAEASYARRLLELSEGLRCCLLVKNSSLFMGGLVSLEPEAIEQSRAKEPERI